MNSFLYNLAHWIYNKSKNLPHETLLVFPNRRSGVFFLHHYKEVASKSQAGLPVWLPKIKTINEFLADYSSLRMAEPIELMADLYVSHQQESGSKESFDDFYFWAEMMLNDFNDVDKYLANPALVFTNVKDFKSIEDKIGFLTDEQLTVIQRFFKNFSQLQQSVLKDKFLEIWEVLLPVYQRFQSLLNANQVGYEGMIYRDALKNILNADANSFPFKKVYFAGFNAITPCEEQIFTNLKERGLAGFFWDFDEYYIKNETFEAGFFQRKYIKKFPPEPDFSLPSTLTSEQKEITIISVPTDAGQVFKASQILGAMNNADYSNTALVLAEENLLFPALNSIPENINQLNITMGFPLSDSSAGSFIQALIQLQLNTKKTKDEKVSFYFKNVLSLLQHPFIQKSDAQLANALLEFIKINNLIQVADSELSSSELLKTVFYPVESIALFPIYIKNIFQHLMATCWKIDSDNRLLMEKEFFFKSLLKINQLTREIEKHKLNMLLPTYFRLIRSVLQQIRIPFEGEPISGLQIMGFLETRNLDFEEVIILSVNEGVLPTASHTPSFIPYSLRRGFGLPTRELHDAMYAYYFYRLLQRPKKVWLIYNSGVGGLVSGEKSRYIHQLLYDGNFKTHSINVNQTVEVITNQSIVIKKEGQVVNLLNQFLGNEPSKTLSPSALSAYLVCPLRFYFKSIVGIKEPDEIEEQIDARLFGSIFHLVSEKFYTHFFKDKQLVTEQALTDIEKNTIMLDDWIKESFKEVLLGKTSKRVFEINGKNHIVFDVIRKYLHQLIHIDKKNTPFSLVGLELKIQMPFAFAVNGQMKQTQIGGFIDRIDRTQQGIRIIDYKTGSDKLNFDELQDLFTHEKGKDTKAVFQTFVYSALVAFNYPHEPVILPMVYQVGNFFDDANSFAVKSAKYLPFASGNFKSIEPEFLEGLTNLLSTIFDEKIPFHQTEDAKNCIYCPYKIICGR